MVGLKAALADQNKKQYTHCDTAKSCRLLPKPLQKPLPQRDAYHCRNLGKHVQAENV